METLALQGLRGGFGEVSGRFRGGFGEVSGRFRGGFGEVSGRFRGGFGEVSERFREGYGEVSERFREGFGQVSGRFRGVFGEGSGRFRGGFCQAPLLTRLCDYEPRHHRLCQGLLVGLMPMNMFVGLMVANMSEARKNSCKHARQHVILLYSPSQMIASHVQPNVYKNTPQPPYQPLGWSYR